MSNAHEGWVTTKFGAVFDQRRELGRGEDSLLSVTADRGVISQEDAGRRNISSEDKSRYKQVRRGDIVYNTMRMWQGVSGMACIDGIVSPAYTVCAPKAGFDASFLAWLLKHPAQIAQFRSYSQGLVSDTWNLRFSTFSDLPATLPRDQAEQRRVAEVLDAIDERIDVSEQVVDKLARTAKAETDFLIQNSNFPIRELGGILANDPRNGYSPHGVDEWTGIVALGLGCLTRNGFAPVDLKNVPAGDPRTTSALLGDGDLLMSRSNTPELVGLVGRYRDVAAPCIYPDLMMRLVLRDDYRSDFVELALRTPQARQKIQSLAQGTSGSMVKINSYSVKSLPVPVPSIEDQNRIIAVSRMWAERLAREQAELDKLRLLRTGLMDDLLTGKVRVTRSGELTG